MPALSSLTRQDLGLFSLVTHSGLACAKLQVAEPLLLHQAPAVTSSTWKGLQDLVALQRAALTAEEDGVAALLQVCPIARQCLIVACSSRHPGTCYCTAAGLLRMYPSACVMLLVYSSAKLAVSPCSHADM